MNGSDAKKTWTDADFEQMCWHDNYIHGVFFYVEGWTTNLVLDVDYIAEWVCGTDGSARFRISPATLTFENVTDLKIDIDWGDSGFQVSLHPVSIHEIRRERIKNQRICLDRPYYQWTVATNFPEAKGMSFGSTGFTQVLRSNPIACDDQVLPLSKREKFEFPS